CVSFSSPKITRRSPLGVFKVKLTLILMTVALVDIICSLSSAKVRPACMSKNKWIVFTKHHDFGWPVPLCCSIFWVPLFCRSRFLMPKSDSSASCQKGAPTLNNMTMMAQPTSVVTSDLRVCHHWGNDWFCHL